ncbi:hypothetical protein JNJ66_07370 [Candidatus Saccharibacteria bacterium]|nr:hypothetical protein [Candidatus Saccharibacteria bacterium]
MKLWQTLTPRSKFIIVLIMLCMALGLAVLLYSFILARDESVRQPAKEGAVSQGNQAGSSGAKTHIALVDTLQAITASTPPPDWQEFSDKEEKLNFAHPGNWNVAIYVEKLTHSEPSRYIMISRLDTKTILPCSIGHSSLSYLEATARFEAQDQDDDGVVKDIRSKHITDIKQKDEFILNDRKAIRYVQVTRPVSQATTSKEIQYYFESLKGSYSYRCNVTPELDEKTIDSVINHLNFTD